MNTYICILEKRPIENRPICSSTPKNNARNTNKNLISLGSLVQLNSVLCCMFSDVLEDLEDGTVLPQYPCLSALFVRLAECKRRCGTSDIENRCAT